MTPFEAITGVVNACQPAPGVVTGGQPGVGHLEALKAAGAAMVIDLREPMERRPLDEAGTIASLGMEYLNLPVGPHTMNDATIDALREALARADGRPVFVHCASANRVGGALIPWFMLDQGLEEDDAIDAAMRVGLRSAELMEWGLRYARSRMVS
jgi:protein tyrosine phosphatase (PTP) superfamily phosphohydrolase (DUF442 family)